ncbi:hypothetical protein DFP72DRAFT_843356 [Ephemerocybe angulata]|uniref:VWFA domain-containing protein n=1 Tax=Ephemerocybe angulata TaxID=980116 RepID=A0A8H6M9X0_9AGAR|nr:hypothetical protein DFP72DRAFT_843356 [Tulosesus angulatus]
MASSSPPSVNTPITDPGAQPGPPEEPTKRNAISKPLDILFLQDATGSQGPYIKAARTAISDICTTISSSASLSKGSLRFGLVAFRDHPPQDLTFITKNFGFTSDVAQIRKNLAGLSATGGGDPPEASTAALAEALNMEWEEDAVKIVVLITDAPPHGIGESRDAFPDGSPDQNDPLDIARQLAERGITLYIIACEPTLSSQFLYAIDFYRALCQITSGRMVPLLNAAQLGDYIVGSALETMETEALINQYENIILEDVYGQGKGVEEVTEKVQEQIDKKKTEINTLNVEDVYEPNEAADRNTKVWMDAVTIKTRGQLNLIRGQRLKASFKAELPSGGLFGFGTESTVFASGMGGHGLFGASPPVAPIPGAPLSGGLFGSSGGTGGFFTGGGGSLFGSTGNISTSNVGGGGLFGSTTATGGLFGGGGGSVFGSSASSKDSGSFGGGGLFGGGTAANGGGSAFTYNSTGTASTGGFGGGVFGSAPPPPSSEGLLGSNPTGGLGLGSLAAPHSTGGFGGFSSPATGAFGGFSSPMAFGAHSPESNTGKAAGPSVSVASQSVAHSQTKRVVMQSLMRKATVGPGGVLTPKGVWAGSAPVATEPSDANSTGPKDAKGE